MPLYDDHFSGHLEHGDPRTPLTAAGACVWPTMPAHRYLLSSTDAYGILSPINGQGILVEKDTVGIAHDSCTWNMIRGPAPILFVFLTKSTAPDRQSYYWDIAMSATVCGIMTARVTRSLRKCNEDFPIGDLVCPGYYGGTGSTFKAEQVEWDHLEPP